MQTERERVEKADFAPEVQQNVCQRHEAFAALHQGFRDFWNARRPDSIFTARSKAMTSYSKEVIRDLAAGTLPWPQTKRIMSAYKDDDRFFKYRRRAAGPRRLEGPDPAAGRRSSLHRARAATSA